MNRVSLRKKISRHHRTKVDTLIFHHIYMLAMLGWLILSYTTASAEMNSANQPAEDPPEEPPDTSHQPSNG